MFVMVTGCGGFLGSHIAKRHLDMGDYVLGLDNWCSSSPDSEHARVLNHHENCLLLGCDITNESDIDYCIDDAFTSNFGSDIDIIYNFACPASPPRYQAMPIETMMTCVVGTKNMLEIARANGSVVVHASTSEIYGDPDISPQNERYRGYVNSFGPRSCYDEGKRAAEALCFDYIHKYNVDVRIVRIFNTYGPHLDMNDGRVVTNMISQALDRDDLTVYGDGSQTRSFCYVDDFIKAIVTLGTLVNDQTLNRPINLGNPDEFTILQLAELICELTSTSQSKIVRRPIPIDDPLRRKPDISLAKTLLKWEPKIQLREGLQKTIDYIKHVKAQSM